MQFEIGKYYKLRDGRVVGPLLPWDEDNLSMGYQVEKKLDGYYLMWDAEGKFDGFVIAKANDAHSHLDLVEVVAETPENR